MKLSAADQRVISHLRQRKQATVSAIAAACFAVSGKARGSATLPAAAHLARMEDRRLIRKEGRHYVLEAETRQPTFFDTEA